ncbi:MAG: GatB/YqeY domain-containing protein [Bacteroidales bacterium]|nr:GatB/YqeY domain-containing protein [Bacteroidales bacterium]
MGTYFNQINEDIKKAMLAKEKEKLEALRAIKSAFLLAKADNAQNDLSDEEEIKIMQKLHKQRLDSAEIYKTNNRQELANKELFEASVIQQYLPKLLSHDELEKEIKAIIVELGATEPSAMGKVMGVATKKLAGKANNKDIAEMVKHLLNT